MREPRNEQPGMPPRADRAFPATGRPASESRVASGQPLQWPPDEQLTAGIPAHAAPRGPEATLWQAADWLLDDTGLAAVNPPRTADNLADRSLIRQVDGAPATSMPGLAGRFAAEWCPTGTTSRRNSLQRERGRTGGGVMVRRAILDRGEAPASEDQALPLSQFPPDPVRPQSRSWRGAGGRWLVWAGRAIAWAVLLVIGYRGVLAIVTGQADSRASAGAPASVTGTAAFPASLAEAYALQFGRVYLNFSPATAVTRGQELSRFLAPDADPQAGWNGAGTQHLLSEQVAGVTVASAHSAVITLLATIDDGRMIELGVPVYSAQGAMIVSAKPSLLPAPARAAAPAASTGSDQAAEAALASQLPAFFQAYASGDRTTLARFAAPGSHIRSLGGTVTFGGIDSVSAPRGGAQRSVTVTVTWKLAPAPGTSGAVASAPAALEMAYQLTVIRQGGSWDVSSIGPAQGPP
jgi:hypothetical protein